MLAHGMAGPFDQPSTAMPPRSVRSLRSGRLAKLPETCMLPLTLKALKKRNSYSQSFSQKDLMVVHAQRRR
jgi:hypothetical protein